MKRLILAAMTIMILGAAYSCDPHKGCTDSKALNHSSDAEADNGTCVYSSVIFYMSVIDPNRPVTVSVNGSSIGTITSMFPGGPGNCSAPGCAFFQFTAGKKLDWVATEPGGLIWTGTIEPNSFQECIKVRVY
jgi:hypothetical protein